MAICGFWGRDRGHAVLQETWQEPDKTLEVARPDTHVIDQLRRADKELHDFMALSDHARATSL